MLGHACGILLRASAQAFVYLTVYEELLVDVREKIGRGGLSSPESPRLAAGSPVLCMSQHRLNFLDEVAYVFELPIDRCEAYVRDLIDFLEAVHHQIAENRTRDLPEVTGIDFAFHFADDRFDCRRADGPLIAGLL